MKLESQVVFPNALRVIGLVDAFHEVVLEQETMTGAERDERKCKKT